MSPRFVFFGSSEFSVYVLDALKEKQILPTAIVTFPDKPQGRKLALTPNVVKTWALEHDISLIEVKTFKDEAIRKQLEELQADVFVVASFGKILPDWLIYMPEGKTLNVHPSLLPKLRGASPLQTAILREDHTGVTIMRLDEKMDEGPLVAQLKVTIQNWPIGYKELEKILGFEGGVLLADTLVPWIKKEKEEILQDHAAATYTKMIEKEDGDISNDPPEVALRKIKAFEVWPRAFTFFETKSGHKERLIVTDAHIEADKLVFDKVIPEGKKEMSWAEYTRGH
jgi:methionyl-tRNA formyltransferase